ncbi:MAG: diacylglycerol kinase [Nautiliaceae bacterium]
MKPKYSFMKNFKYAREGFKSVFLNESSFKLQVLFFVIFSIVALFLPYPIWAKVFIIASMLVPVVVELLNSAIEGVVDLVSPNFHELAKYAKDAAAAAVMVSIVIPIMVWVGFIIYFW